MLVLDRTLSPSRSAGQFDDADESRRPRPRPRPRRMISRSASPDRFLNLHTEDRQTALSLIPGRAHWCDYWICWDISLLGCCDGEGAHAGGSSYASCRQRQSDGDLYGPINGGRWALTALTPSTPSTPLDGMDYSGTSSRHLSGCRGLHAVFANGFVSPHKAAEHASEGRRAGGRRSGGGPGWAPVPSLGMAEQLPACD